MEHPARFYALRHDLSRQRCMKQQRSEISNTRMCITIRVARAINNIKTNSAPGPDGIPPKFIKMAKAVLVPVLTKLYNKCLKEKCFMDDFKLSHIIPIP